MKNRDIIVLKKIMDYNKFVENSVFQSGLQFSMICRS